MAMARSWCSAIDAQTDGLDPSDACTSTSRWSAFALAAAERRRTVISCALWTRSIRPVVSKWRLKPVRGLRPCAFRTLTTAQYSSRTRTSSPTRTSHAGTTSTVRSSRAGRCGSDPTPSPADLTSTGLLRLGGSTASGRADPAERRDPYVRRHTGCVPGSPARTGDCPRGSTSSFSSSIEPSVTRRLVRVGRGDRGRWRLRRWARKWDRGGCAGDGPGRRRGRCPRTSGGRRSRARRSGVGR
jgi:hypothetical protein